MTIFLRSVLIGLATGGRSSLGIATLALTAPDTGSRWTSRPAKVAAVLAAAGELTVDKLPQTPSRLDPRGQVFRAVAGAAAGAILAQREGNGRSRTVLAGVLSAAGAWAGAQAGAHWRGLAASKIGPDWPGAIAEDALSVALARQACRD